MELCNLKWKEFFISEIFPKPKRGKRIVNDNHIAGNTPLVSSAGTNNGITAFIGNTENVRLYQNCLSIANGGSSAGRCFYEPFEFIASDHITHCKNNELTENQYLAVASLISGKLSEKYSFCREITDLRISREKIMLPVNEDGKPDFECLEQYVKQLKERLTKKYLDYVKKSIANISVSDVVALEQKEWKVYQLSNLFKIYHGKRLVKENRISGKIPLLTASESNQGVSDFINNVEMKSYSDFISIDMFGHAFYHNYKCYGDDNIYFLINNQISKYAKIFIANCISKNTIKYSYGNQFRQGNADRDKILLPKDNKGNPDYEYMEQYIKNIMIKKYKSYIAYVEKNNV